MIERALEFGPGRRLVGVLAHSDATAPARDIAVLITNSGIIHRVGANRLHVRLARSLAERGYSCLRYDLPGIGDSERIGTGSHTELENLTATRAALDALEQAGVARRFIMIGLCSGADHSFRVACGDPRVAGAVLIDPTVMFSTRRHNAHRVLRTVRRAIRPRHWARALTGKPQVGGAPRSGADGPGAPRSLQRSRHPEAWSQSHAAFRSLLDREVRLFMVITRHSGEIYSYRRQIFDVFPDLADLEQFITVRLRPQSGHTFGTETDRSFLEAAIIDWLSASFVQNARLDRDAPASV
jgi:pimeloyl-ACP methyl ester carboxylesterase